MLFFGSGEFINRDSKLEGQSGNNHYKECDYFPLKCVNKCGKVVKCKDIKSHHNECPLEVIKCPFADCTKSTILTPRGP